MRTITSSASRSTSAGAIALARRACAVRSSIKRSSRPPVGVTLSSYLVMVVVAVLYGSFRLAAEIEASRFPRQDQDPVFGTNVDVHYCADSKQQPTNVSFDQQGLTRSANSPTT